MTDTRGALAVDRPELRPKTAAASNLLELAGIEKRWGARAVLDGVDLAAGRGTLVSVSGANGTGKTTLLRIAAGLIQPDAGKVALDGLDPERDRRRYLTRLGFLSAGDRGLARLSARRHLDLAARLSFVPARGRAAAVRNALDLFDLADYGDRRVDRLSTGQRQRVRLAMTFVHSPDLVLLDEPANSLDPDGLEVLARYLDLVRARGGSAVWCAPDVAGSTTEADIFLRLVSGRLLRA
jgi:ABC-type multidrug transport system ATPase subunit